MPTDGNPTPDAAAEQESLRLIAPALRKKLQQCYDHGTKLMQQETYDFDYAHSILIECVVNDPGNLVYVEAFLQNLQRKFHQNKRGALLAFGGKGPFKKAVTKKDWDEVLKLGPAILKSNPWDVATLRGMAEACAACGYSDVELRYLKNALDVNPKDPEVNRHCAQSLARTGRYDQAIACWTRVDEARRGDDEAQRMISDLQIAKTQARHGFGKPEAARRGAGGTRSTAAAAEHPESHEPAAAEPARREIKRTPRQELEQALANNPADIDSYLELAQLHVAEDRLGEAAHLLTKALAASGNAIRIQERIEDVEILRKKQQLAIAEKRAESDPSPANQELAHRLRDDLNRLELEIYDRRAQRYPASLEWKFQLGVRLKRAGQLREAIAQLELAQSLPDRHSGAALEIGECFQRQKQYDKALKYYTVAAEESAPERLELKKLALYRRGVLAEGLKHWTDAEASYQQLSALDPRYRDAATRLDKIQAMRHKHT